MTAFAARLEIPAESPFFRGHFPGQEILPGVALLELVRRAASLERGSELEVRGVDGVRLRRPVSPGEVLDVELSIPSDESRVRFHVTSRGEPVAGGAFASASAEPSAAAARAERSDARGSIRACTDLLPHGAAARLVTEVVELEDERIVCRARIPQDSPFRDARTPGLAPFLSLEMGAQTAAAHECLLASKDGGASAPRRGYFVGARTARFEEPWLDAKLEYVVHAERIGRAGPLFVYGVSVSTAEGHVAAARISTYSVPDDAGQRSRKQNH